MNDHEEIIYLEGKNNALKDTILHCQNELRNNGVELKTDEKFSQERVDVIKTLRSFCREFGDNNWDDNLHLSDVIDKHLAINLDSRPPEMSLKEAYYEFQKTDEYNELKE